MLATITIAVPGHAGPRRPLRVKTAASLPSGASPPHGMEHLRGTGAAPYAGRSPFVNGDTAAAAGSLL